MKDNTGKKILVVEDDQDTRIFLYNLLNSNGLKPVVTENHTEGLKKVFEENPSVIIINMMISGGGGVQMYHQLKRDENLKNIPVIMLSTLDQKTFFKCRKIRNARSDQDIPENDIFLEKPLETEELIKTVKQLIKIKLNI